MKKRLFAFSVVFVIMMCLFSSCEGDSLKNSSAPDGQASAFSPWGEERPLMLLTKEFKEIKSSVSASYNGDSEAVRREVGSYTDLNEIESKYQGTEMRWIKCEAHIAQAEDEDRSIRDAAFLIHFEAYGRCGGSKEFAPHDINSSGIFIYSSDREDVPFTVVLMAFDSLSEKPLYHAAFAYAYVPAGSESEFVFAVAKRKLDPEREAFELPQLPDSSVLCWKIPEIK